MWAGMPGAGLTGGRGRCLGDHLTAYADRAMDDATLLRWDRHVVDLSCCRAAVDAERRVLSALRSSAGSPVPGDLRGMLLALGAQTHGPQPVAPYRRTRPGCRRCRCAPVRVVDRALPPSTGRPVAPPSTPAWRAGATAAAALSLVVSGGLTTSNPSVSPAVQGPDLGARVSPPPRSPSRAWANSPSGTTVAAGLRHDARSFGTIDSMSDERDPAGSEPARVRQPPVSP